MALNGGWRARVRGTVAENAPLAQHTTFRVGGPAKYLVTPSSTEDVREVLASGEKVFVLGAGSNVLASDAGFDGVVLKICNALSSLSVVATGVTAGAGRSLAAVAKACEDLGLTGLEWAVGIPGTTGGAACTNAGAFGGAVWDVAACCAVVAAGGHYVLLGPAEVKRRYRGADFPLAKPFVVIDVSFRLAAAEPAKVRETGAAYRARRTASQPLGAATAGCVFKNPPEGPAAGALIDRAGLKGTRVGDAVVSEKHANFIINGGNSTATDIYRLMTVVREKVQREFGVVLELEVELLGDFADA